MDTNEYSPGYKAIMALKPTARVEPVDETDADVVDPAEVNYRAEDLNIIADRSNELVGLAGEYQAAPDRAADITGTEVSLEALAVYKSKDGILHNLFNYFRDIKNFITGRIKPEYASVVKVDTKELQTLFGKGKAKWTDISTIDVFVPTGLSSTWLDYLGTLDSIQSSFMDSFYSETLLPFNRWIGSCLLNPDKLKDIMGSARFVSHDVDAMLNEMKKHFRGGSDRSKFGKVVGKIDDLAAVQELYESIGHRHMSNSILQVQATVNELATNIDKLITLMNDPSSQYRPAGNTIQLLSKACYQYAREVEFYATYCASMKLLGTTMADAIAVAVKKAK